MIVITGATGTVGRETIQLLLEAGHKVKAISRDPSGSGLPDSVELVVGNPSAPRISVSCCAVCG
ncbi:NAD(P)H-binding protein [Nocardia sp. SYP-A9097]|uniref:NAD(P)H-binding protein n=1 Tax=Nocardia sp. SYP-A9097 TaxID=2663237 RepID=UPI0018910A88|nr:NAD(P)H-binding protein [Nocardia sp. SYP-A9097]